jgi:hypothetical protein
MPGLPTPVRGSLITGGAVVGGLVLGVGVGDAVNALAEGLPLVVQRGLAAVPALSIVSAAGALWGRGMGRLAGASEPRRMSWAGAFGFGPPVIAAGIVLSLLEPLFVERSTDLPIHVAFRILFTTAAFIVGAAGACALGIGLRDWRLTGRLVIAVGAASGGAFLAIALTMDALGWRVGGPDAARRATMVTVATLGSLAAALASGAVIGRMLGHRPRLQDLGLRPVA